MSNTPPNGLFITGTDTGVGKTVVTAALARCLRGRGLDVGVFKPVATGAILENGKLLSLDARFLKTVSDVSDSLDEICPILFELPAAPSVAARVERHPFVQELILLKWIDALSRHEAFLVEGVGGWRVPLAGQFTVRDFAQQLKLPVLVVARDWLGAINHTVLTLESIHAAGLPIAGVVFVQTSPPSTDSVLLDSAREIQNLFPTTILGTLPFDPTLSVADNRPGNLVELFSRHVNINSLVPFFEGA